MAQGAGRSLVSAKSRCLSREFESESGFELHIDSQIFRQISRVSPGRAAQAVLQSSAKLTSKLACRKATRAAKARVYWSPGGAGVPESVVS